MKFALCTFLLVGVSALPQTHSGAGNRLPFKWNPASARELDLEDSINNSSLTRANRHALVRAIAAQLRPFMADLEIGSEQELLTVAAKTRVKVIDLNGDGVPEVIAQPVGLEGGCGATGNCPFWVFGSSQAGFKLLLNDRHNFQSFELQPTRTNGYRDIVLGTHDSATDRTLVLFRFKNGEYRGGDCYQASFATIDEKGLHELRKPIITSCRE